jgi:hypothetical protein
MAIPASINRRPQPRPSRGAVRVLGDPPMTWVAAEVDSEHALRTWFDAGAPQGACAYHADRAAVEREEAAARDLQRLAELTQPRQEGCARSH